MQAFKSDNRNLDLIIKLTGKFVTAFPDGIIELKSPEDLKEEKREHLNKSTVPSSVILVGDTDMLFNPFCVVSKKKDNKTVVECSNSNIAFVINAVDYLTRE